MTTYPKTENPRYVSLDIWRGLACLMIVVLHAVYVAKCGDASAQALLHPTAARLVVLLSHLGVGVPMFFVISGYCISATADSSRRKGRAARDFFVRRLRRIYPPFWVALILTIALFAVAARLPALAGDPSDVYQRTTGPSALSPSQWIGNVTLTETWLRHLTGGSETHYLGPAWTLCYEEQFYVVCGLIVLFIPRRFFAGALGVSIMTIATFALSIALPAVRIKGFFFDGKWLMFASGVLVYYCLNYLPKVGKMRGSLVLIAAIVAAKVITRLLRARHIDMEVGVDDPYAWSLAFTFALAILLLRPLDGWICRLKLLTPVALCGRMCYSLYLVHWPLAHILGNAFYAAGVHDLVMTLTVTVPIIVVVSILAGWAFHLLVERHFLNPPQTSIATRTQTAPAILSVNSSIVAVGS